MLIKLLQKGEWQIIYGQDHAFQSFNMLKINLIFIHNHIKFMNCIS